MAQTRAVRDLRVDFLRGCALLGIFTLHVNAPLVKKFTPFSLGFSDAAEVFIFLSGYVCGLVYDRALTGGFLTCQLKALRRCGEIYVAHIVSLFVTLAALGALFGSSSFQAAYAGLFLQDPVQAIERACALSYFPWVFNILPLYIPLLLSLPVMLWLSRRAGLSAMLLVSFALWLAVQFRPTALRLPSTWGDSWFFNPFAWQFLFYLGVALGSRPEAITRWLPRGRAFVAAGLAGLMFAFLLKLVHIVINEPSYFETIYGAAFEGRAWNKLYPHRQYRFPFTHKQILEPVRLVHFFLLAYVTWALLPAAGAIWQWRSVRLIVRCGQQTLAVFCFSIVLTNLVNAFLGGPDAPWTWQLGVNVVGWLMMLGLASLLHGANKVLASASSRQPAAEFEHSRATPPPSRQPANPLVVAVAATVAEETSPLKLRIAVSSVPVTAPGS